MTPEEMQAAIDDLKAQVEATNAKNRELLATNSKLKKQSNEVDVDAYHKTLDELESVKSENAKLQNDVKLKAKDFEKLTASLSEKDGALQGLLIDQGLTQALTEVGVDPKVLKYVKADLKSQAKLQGENGQYTAMIGDKPLSDFINEWKDGDGKDVIIAPTNTGGGSQGGNGTQTAKTASRTQFDSMSPVDKSSFVKSGGTITQ